MGGTGRALGRAGLTIGFGIVGNIIAPGLGGAIGTALGAFVGSQLLPPQFPDELISGPQLGDRQVQTTTYGNAIPFVWGTVRIAGNIIWATDIIPTKHTQTTRQGGKGGGGGRKQTTVTYTYSVSLAIALCRGPITGVRRVYADKEVVSDPENPSLDDEIEYTLYDGGNTQLPDPDVEADVGVGLTPGFRGMAYVVMSTLQLDRFNNRVPNFSFEIVQGGNTTAPSVENSVVVDAVQFKFDPETRLLWVLESGFGGVSTIRVMNPNDMSILHTISSLTNNRQEIEYTPGYILVEISIISGTPIISEIPPQMHIGSDSPSALPDSEVVRIDTHTYKQSLYDPNNNAFRNNAKPMFHWETVTLEGPNFSRPRISIGDGPAVSQAVELQLHPGGNAGSSSDFGPWNINPTGRVEDHVSFGSGMYVVTFNRDAARYDSNGIRIWSTAAGGSINNGDGRITYHEDVDAVFTATGRTNITRFNSTSGALEFTRTYANRDPMDIKYHRELGDLWVLFRDGATDAFLTRLDPANGDVLEELDLDFGLSTTPNSNLFLYPGTRFAFVITSSGRMHRVPLFKFPTASTVSVRSIVDEILDECGIDSTLRDTAALATLTIKGYNIGMLMSGRQALEPLLRSHLVDGVESDYKLRFIQRGGSSTASIVEEEMGAALVGGNTSQTLGITRTDETELPNQIDVVYIDQDFDYNFGTQYDRRLVTLSKTKRAINVPVVMNATKARQLASVFLHNIWREKDALTWSTTVKFLAVDPADVIILTLKDGMVITARVTKTQYTVPGLIQMRGFIEDISVYTQLIPGVPTLIAKKLAQLTVPTILQFMDIPLLRDKDEDAGFYIGASGPYPGWQSAELHQSDDQGASYEFKQLLTKEVTYGFAVTSLATTSQPFTFDDINTVDVELVNGSLSSSTDDAILAFTNLALLGDEIIQFVTVTALGNNRFRLSRLLRGRQGTDTFVATHSTFDRFVFLSLNTIDRVRLTFSDLGVSRTYKAVSERMTLGQTYPRVVIPQGVGLKPYNPRHVLNTKAGNDFIITWIRRARVRHGWIDSIDVPLDEPDESYDVEIFDGPTVVRTIVVTSPTVTYTEAQQITDFGSAQSSVDIIVYQNSGDAFIDRGFGQPATIS